jgi:hypothetical protein
MSVGCSCSSSQWTVSWSYIVSNPRRCYYVPQTQLCRHKGILTSDTAVPPTSLRNEPKLVLQSLHRLMQGETQERVLHSLASLFFLFPFHCFIRSYFLSFVHSFQVFLVLFSSFPLFWNNKLWDELIAYFLLIQHGPHRKRRLQQFFGYRGNVFSGLLPSSDGRIHR